MSRRTAVPGLIVAGAREFDGPRGMPQEVRRLARPTRTARPPGAVLRAAAILPALLAPAAADEAGAPPARLTVAVPPGSGPTAGFDRDLFAALAVDIGSGITVVEAPPAAALAGLDGGRFDVAAGPFAPGEAAGRRALPPVAIGGEALLKRRGDGALLEAADVAGKRIGVPDAAVGASVRRLAAALKARVTLHGSFRPGDGEGDLAAGRVAALAGSVEAVAAAALARPGAVEVVGPPFGAAPRLAPAMRPGPEADRLAGVVAGALRRMRADGRLAALQRRWFGLAFDPPAAVPVPSPITSPAPAPLPGGTPRPTGH